MLHFTSTGSVLLQGCPFDERKVQHDPREMEVAGQDVLACNENSAETRS